METKTKPIAIPMQVPVPVTQNERIHANMQHAREIPTQMGTSAHTDTHQSIQHTPRLTQAQQQAEPQPPG